MHFEQLMFNLHIQTNVHVYQVWSSLVVFSKQTNLTSKTLKHKFRFMGSNRHISFNSKTYVVILAFHILSYFNDFNVSVLQFYLSFYPISIKSCSSFLNLVHLFIFYHNFSVQAHGCWRLSVISLIFLLKSGQVKDSNLEISSVETTFPSRSTQREPKGGSRTDNKAEQCVERVDTSESQGSTESISINAEAGLCLIPVVSSMSPAGPAPPATFPPSLSSAGAEDRKKKTGKKKENLPCIICTQSE